MRSAQARSEIEAVRSVALPFSLPCFLLMFHVGAFPFPAFLFSRGFLGFCVSCLVSLARLLASEFSACFFGAAFGLLRFGVAVRARLLRFFTFNTFVLA